jgi:hypothetical protein
MNNVYYILGLMSNFMSIGCMVDKGFIFIFDKDQCLVHNGPDQVIEKRIWDQCTGLYQYIINNPTFPICVVQSIKVNCLWCWWLGNLNQHSPTSMGSKGDIIGVPFISRFLEVCNSCHVRKQCWRWSLQLEELNNFLCLSMLIFVKWFSHNP